MPHQSPAGVFHADSPFGPGEGWIGFWGVPFPSNISAGGGTTVGEESRPEGAQSPGRGERQVFRSACPIRSFGVAGPREAQGLG